MPRQCRWKRATAPALAGGAGEVATTVAKPKGRSDIVTENIIFWLILDPITFGLGSIGGYILFQQFVEHERLPRGEEWLHLLRRYWYALLALGISVGYFFFRLLYFLNSS